MIETGSETWSEEPRAYTHVIPTLFSASCSPTVSASWLPRDDHLSNHLSNTYQLFIDTQTGSVMTILELTAVAGRMGGGRLECLSAQTAEWREHQNGRALRTKKNQRGIVNPVRARIKGYLHWNLSPMP